ncbi:MAG: hypothetical protein JXJ19_01620 [Elusimicrobia bacterium]|nr:hypothetical protein [Elusimicrobiota bacterium]
MHRDLRPEMKKINGKLVCPECGQQNDTVAEYCWACYTDFIVQDPSAKAAPPRQAAAQRNGTDSLPGNKLIIKQKKHLGEVLIDWEFVNEYRILSEKGEDIGHIKEQKKSFAHAFFIRRWGSVRNYDIIFYDRFQKQMLMISRPLTFFGMSKVRVIDGSGRHIGTVKRVFPPFIRKRYLLFDGTGVPLAMIKGSLIRIWTFNIFDMQGIQVAGIYKKWSGLAKEIFTDADNFVADMGNIRDDAFRKLILAASIVIDFDFFERRSDR